VWQTLWAAFILSKVTSCHSVSHPKSPGLLCANRKLVPVYGSSQSDHTKNYLNECTTYFFTEQRNCNESYSSIKYREFLGQVSDCQLLHAVSRYFRPA
jgi:hypothetical protein